MQTKVKKSPRHFGEKWFVFFYRVSVTTFFFFECVCVWARVLVVRNRRPSRDWGSDVIQKLMDVAHLYSPPVPTYTLLSSSCFVFFPVGNAPTHARTCNDDIPHYD